MSGSSKRERFVGLFESSSAGPRFDRLAALYGGPGRRYHDLTHIGACLTELDQLTDLAAADRRMIELALWWHDAVYDPTRSDNEERSALLAGEDLAALGCPVAELEEVVRLIRLTSGHRVDANDELGAVLVSIDLGILGASPAAYARYAAQIREEYAFVPEALYREGRAAILRRFLDGPIFPNPAFAKRLDTQARQNIEAEMAQLSR